MHVILCLSIEVMLLIDGIVAFFQLAEDAFTIEILEDTVGFYLMRDGSWIHEDARGVVLGAGQTALFFVFIHSIQFLC